MDIPWRKILFHPVRSHEGNYHITSKVAAVNGKIENFDPSPMCSFPDEIYEGIQCHRASSLHCWILTVLSLPSILFSPCGIGQCEVPFPQDQKRFSRLPQAFYSYLLCLHNMYVHVHATIHAQKVQGRKTQRYRAMSILRSGQVI